MSRSVLRRHPLQGLARHGWSVDVVLWLVCCLLLASQIGLVYLATGPAVTDAADPLAGVIQLADARITESSGLAKSHHLPGAFWTHNDSGDSARLFAFGEHGEALGECTLAGVKAIDFEDLASLVQDGVPRLLVADVGDNRSRRATVSLYLFDEPDPQGSSEITDWQQLEFRYPDGPRDCEAVAVDAAAGKILLVSKTFLPRAAVYELDLPPRNVGVQQRLEPQTARRVGQLPLSLVTAMDRDDTCGDLLLVNYFQLFRFPCPQPGQNWWEQTPTPTDLPRLKQIEAVAVDATGQAWVTSEGQPAPLAPVIEAQP